MLPYIELLKAIEKDYGRGDAYYEVEQAIFDKNLAIIPSILRRYELDKEYSHLTRVNEADKKNTHSIILTFDDERRIKRVQTTPVFQKMLAPNQIKNLKVGDNALVVNNVALNGLERMESTGLYTLKKDIAETDKKKTPALNKPKRGGSKKFYVYVRDPKSKRIKKVSFGMAGGGLRAKLNNSKARQAFSKRHNCPQKKDKTKASYWSCRLPRYAKALGFNTTFSGYW